VFKLLSVDQRASFAQPGGPGTPVQLAIYLDDFQAMLADTTISDIATTFTNNQALITYKKRTKPTDINTPVSETEHTVGFEAGAGLKLTQAQDINAYALADAVANQQIATGTTFGYSASAPATVQVTEATQDKLVNGTALTKTLALKVGANVQFTNTGTSAEPNVTISMPTNEMEEYSSFTLTPPDPGIVVQCKAVKYHNIVSMQLTIRQNVLGSDRYEGDITNLPASLWPMTDLTYAYTSPEIGEQTCVIRATGGVIHIAMNYTHIISVTLMYFSK
jgi:hypothetical protein